VTTRSPILHPVANSGSSIAFLFDVDNTLLDNDRVKAELAEGINRAVGVVAGARFWEIYEDVRRVRDYVDYPRTLERFGEADPNEPGLATVVDLVMNYPYETALYPGALDALSRVQVLGPAAIVTDGDPVYQPAKIERAGLADAVAGRVYITVHKEEQLADVQRAVPADRYVLVDDKLAVLSQVELREAEVLTVHVRQGHYAADTDGYPPADRTLDRIGDLLELDLEAFLAG
jgi:beta-phosphoglucomutase-like phosphatase (HAD superfamily)